MNEEIDLQLLTLFARSSETLPNQEFMEIFYARRERARRARAMRRIALTAALALLGAWAAPTILGRTASAVRAVADYASPLGSVPLGELVVSPAGWAVSMLIGLIVLIRTGALRRF